MEDLFILEEKVTQALQAEKNSRNKDWDKTIRWHCWLGHSNFKYLKRLDSWNNKLPSKAGKKILIKTIDSSNLIFYDEHFLLPSKLCEYIETWIHFGGGVTRRKDKSSWDGLCQGREIEGELGLRKKIQIFNKVLLTISSRYGDFYVSKLW